MKSEKELYLYNTEAEKFGPLIRCSFVRELHDRNHKKYWLVKLEPPQKFYDIHRGENRPYNFVALTARFQNHALEFGSDAPKLVNILGFSSEDPAQISSFETTTFRILGMALAFESQQAAEDYIRDPVAAHLRHSTPELKIL